MVYYLSGFGSTGLCDIFSRLQYLSSKQKWVGCLNSRYSFLSLLFSFSRIRLLYELALGAFHIPCMSTCIFP
jgi:hypothetical protein